MPPEQFGEKIPSFNLLGLNIVVHGVVVVPDMNPPRSSENADYMQEGGGKANEDEGNKTKQPCGNTFDRG
jgi:hypothetical protein